MSQEPKDGVGNAGATIHVTRIDAVDQFRKAMDLRGIIAPAEIIADGCIHRCDVEGKHGKGDASYLLHLDGIPAGGFQNWRDGKGWENWRADLGRAMTPMEEAAHRQSSEATQRAREVEVTLRRAEARKRAAAIWQSAAPAPDDHAYLTAKGVNAHALRVHKGLLVIPLRDTSGQLHSLQFISGNREKRYLTGGRVRGCYFAIGAPKSSLCICEGYATGASIHASTGQAVAVAFDAGNLLAAARSLRAQYPELTLTLCADNDAWTDGNPGVKNATEAARAVDALLVVPAFKDGLSKPTDFNDLHRLEGLEAVRAQIANAARVGRAAGNTQNWDLPGELKNLASLSPLQYELIRVATAERLGVRTTVLDAEVKKLRAVDTTEPGAGKALDIEDVEPYPDPVDGGQLLGRIVSEIGRFVALPDAADIALALWAVHTYAFDYGDCSPILALISPTPRCGKTTTLNLLARLVNRPLSAANISTPSLFRTVEVCQPTLLIDEADTFMRENLELRGVINSGHTRDSAYVIRTVGEDHDPRQFSTWAPKAIASISKLPGTITDRSIVISLRRKLPGDRVTRLTRQHNFHDLRAQVARWVIDHAKEIKAANPDIPVELNDRAADSWRPLLALADLVGGPWPERARQAARKLSGERDEEALGVLLLSDIRTIFEDQKIDRLPSRALTEALGAMEGRPWAEYRNGKPVTANQLARMLNEFGISPAPTRSGDDIFKGYVLDKFSDAFERYLQLAALGGNQAVTRLQANAGAGCDPLQTVTRDLGVTLREELQPNTGAGCNRVTVQKGGKERFGDIAPPAGDEVVI
jgi:putative DNA primase/helicase